MERIFLIKTHENKKENENIQKILLNEGFSWINSDNVIKGYISESYFGLYKNTIMTISEGTKESLLKNKNFVVTIFDNINVYLRGTKITKIKKLIH